MPGILVAPIGAAYTGNNESDFAAFRGAAASSPDLLPDHGRPVRDVDPVRDGGCPAPGFRKEEHIDRRRMGLPHGRFRARGGRLLRLCRGRGMHGSVALARRSASPAVHRAPDHLVSRRVDLQARSRGSGTPASSPRMNGAVGLLAGAGFGVLWWGVSWELGAQAFGIWGRSAVTGLLAAIVTGILITAISIPTYRRA